MKEETIIDQIVVNEELCESQVKQTRKISASAKVGAAAIAGAVMGSGATFGGQAVAATLQENETLVAEEEVEQNVTKNIETANAPVAVVSDDMTFSEAFAAARQQVGAGGVFSWHGKVYGTYYKDEWDNMSAEEKAEFQDSVDYDHISVNENYHATSHVADTDVAANNVVEDIPRTNPNENMQNASNDIAEADIDVHVISVEHNVNMNGNDVDVAVIEVDGHQGILVDVDHDGMVEGAIIDFNDDGQIQENEVSPDLTGSQIQMPQMSDGDLYMAQNDDMPDYTNDALV